ESDAFDTKDLYVRELEGTEALSHLFEFRLRVVGLAGAHLDADTVLGADATIVFEQAGLVVRRVHGTIDEIHDDLDVADTVRSYRLTLLPRASRLAMVATQEVSLGDTVPQIVEKKLSMVGLGADDVDFRLREKYAPREFVLQYRETDLAFVSRLTEHL